MIIKKKWVAWEELLELLDSSGGGGGGGGGGVNYWAVGGLTEGSIPFADASGHLAEDNDKLFWDATNFRLASVLQPRFRHCTLIFQQWLASSLALRQRHGHGDSGNV